MGIKDLTGKRIGHLVVLYRAPNQIRKGRTFAYWQCRCDCGAELPFVSSNLNKAVSYGMDWSCGCREPKLRKNHGLFKLPEYKSWSAMLQRCTNSNNPDFHHYGGRGITVCDRWNDFSNFLEDMGRRPTPKHTLERKENNGNYEKENCRWATRAEQAHNTRTNVMTEESAAQVKAMTLHMSLVDIARQFDVSTSCVSHIKQGRSWKQPNERDHDGEG